MASPVFFLLFSSPLSNQAKEENEGLNEENEGLASLLRREWLEVWQFKKKKTSALRQIFVCILTQCSAMFWNGRVWPGVLGHLLCVSVRFQAPWKTL